jgi:flavin reductase (DIM6/NTAB) family NADH-FMN oxidoreductase RutF
VADETFLITSGDIEGKSNIIAVSFCMPVSKEPPLVACATGRKSYSSKLIEETGEFVVNVPPQELRRQINYCVLIQGMMLINLRKQG